MAKTEKKKNRKLRRRIRRTTAIILMITSIIVAAIPVPENAAAPTGGVAPLNDADRTPDHYDYDVDAAGSDYVNFNDSGLSLSSTAATEPAYTVIESGGNYIYQWQFKYYTAAAAVTGGVKSAIVKEYNPTYRADNVDM